MRHFTGRTCPAEPVCLEMLIMYILPPQRGEEKADIRKTRTRRGCNSELCAMHPLLHAVLQTDQPEAAHIQGLLATSTAHKLFLVWGQGRVPGAQTSQAKNHQTLKCKERNNWIDELVTEGQVCNNAHIEHWKTHSLFLNSDHALSHHTNSYFYCSDKLLWAGLAENEPCAGLPSPSPVLSSHKWIQRFQLQQK